MKTRRQKLEFAVVDNELGIREPINTAPAVEKGLAFTVNPLCHCKWKMPHGNEGGSY